MEPDTQIILQGSLENETHSTSLESSQNKERVCTTSWARRRTIDIGINFLREHHISQIITSLDLELQVQMMTVPYKALSLIYLEFWKPYLHCNYPSMIYRILSRTFPVRKQLKVIHIRFRCGVRLVWKSYSSDTYSHHSGEHLRIE
jgi:hypothetical protein